MAKALLNGLQRNDVALFPCESGPSNRRDSRTRPFGSLQREWCRVKRVWTIFMAKILRQQHLAKENLRALTPTTARLFSCKWHELQGLFVMANRVLQQSARASP